MAEPEASVIRPVTSPKVWANAEAPPNTIMAMSAKKAEARRRTGWEVIFQFLLRADQDGTGTAGHGGSPDCERLRSTPKDPCVGTMIRPNPRNRATERSATG